MSRWRNPRIRLLVTLMAMSAAGLRAGQEPSSWIAVCAGAAPAAAGVPQSTYETADGAGRTVVVTESAPAGCSTTALPFAASEVVWVRLVPPAAANRLGRGFILQGGDTAPRADSELIPVEEDAAVETTSGRGTRPATPDAVRSPQAGRAMWAWRRELWQSNAATLFADAAAWEVRLIYIAVHSGPDGLVAEADRLRAFLAEAADRGLEVWAVDGDPRAVVAAERAAIERRAAAIAAFNAGSRVRIAGIQYDIEPYIIPGYALDEARWNEAYVATIEQLRKAADLPIELAVPFWWLNARTGAVRVMDRVAPWIDSVAVMDYRTDAAAIERLARPWLDWGEQRNRRVRIALEAGPLPNEPRRHFRPAPTGSVWAVDVGDTRALVMLRTPRPNPAGAAFGQVATSMSDASTVTFAGRVDRLRALLPALERRLAASASFAGIALHEVVR
jgi:hypothetical protein